MIVWRLFGKGEIPVDDCELQARAHANAWEMLCRPSRSTDPMLRWSSGRWLRAGGDRLCQITPDCSGTELPRGRSEIEQAEGEEQEEVRKSKIAQLLYLEHDGARAELVSD